METSYEYRERGDAVVATLSRNVDGSLRLSFEDVKRQHMLDATAWLSVAPFTSQNIPTNPLGPEGLSEAELADIGLAVVSRLCALGGTDA